jgi:hypothetical protein
VLVHLNHRLVQMCLRLLRAEIWAQDDVKKLHRVTVRTVPDAQIDGPAVVVVSRLVVTGGNHHRLHEELTVAGGYLGDKPSGAKKASPVSSNGWIKPSRSRPQIPCSMPSAPASTASRSAILQAVDARSKDGSSS